MRASRHVILRLFVWFFAEILLSYLGLDHLADYSEYRQASEAIALVSSL